MSVTRQPLEIACHVELHGERPAVVITYHDGERKRFWRCYFDDAEELAVDLQLAVNHNPDGPLLPQVAADAALACVRETIGSYDELFARTKPSCPATDALRARKPPAAFHCWDRTRWYETAFDCFLFIGGAAFFVWVARLVR